MRNRVRNTRLSAALGGLAAFVWLLPASASGQTAPTEPLPQLPPPPVPEPTTAPAQTPPEPPAAEAPSATPPSTATEEPPRGGAASPGGSFDDVRYRDAHADRVILGSTAETHPAGTFFLTDYEVALLQLGYAVTDSFQLSVTGLPPFVKNQPYFFEFGVKANLVRTATFRAALTGAFDVLTDGSTSRDNPIYAGRFGVIGQFCLDDRCRTSVSLNAGLGGAKGIDQALPVYGSLGLIANVSPLVSILVEPAVGGVVATGQQPNGGAAVVFDYGVRIAGPRFGVDLTFILPAAVTGSDFNNPFLLGYPFVAFTYRTEGTPPGHAGIR